MPYDHQAQRFRIVFEEPDPLAGLVVVVRSSTVDDYVRIAGLTEVGELSAARVEELCEAMGPMLVSWDLSQNGELVPATTAGLRSLDVPLAIRLATEWLTAVARVPAPLGPPSSDGETFQEASLTMEPLPESLPS